MSVCVCIIIGLVNFNDVVSVFTGNILVQCVVCVCVCVCINDATCDTSMGSCASVKLKSIRGYTGVSDY